MTTVRDLDVPRRSFNIKNGRKWHGPQDPPRGHHIRVLAGVPRKHARVVEQNSQRTHTRARQDKPLRQVYQQTSQEEKKYLSNTRPRARRASIRRDNHHDGNNRGARAKRPHTQCINQRSEVIPVTVFETLLPGLRRCANTGHVTEAHVNEVTHKPTHKGVLAWPRWARQAWPHQVRDQDVTHGVNESEIRLRATP